MSAVKYYTESYQKLVKKLPGANLPWLSEEREQAISMFERNGFPHIKDEEWKYTKASHFEKQPFSMVIDSAFSITEQQIEALAIEALDCYRCVFVDGEFMPSAELQSELAAKGCHIMSIRDAIEHSSENIKTWLTKPLDNIDSGFTQLNRALMSQGYYCQVDSGVSIDKPLYLLVITTQAHVSMQHWRNIINLAGDAKIEIIEHYVSLNEGEYFNNIITQANVADNAQLRYTKIQEESKKASHIAQMHVELAEQSYFQSNSLSLGGKLVRSDTHADLNANGATSKLYGFYNTSDEQHIDHHTAINHLYSNTTSDEYYKGILSGKSRAVFNGKVLVKSNAQKVIASQMNKNLLLSDEAEIDTKPQLEIFADDVQCSHGATVGQLDERSLFYLQSRGISRDMATNMLTRAFAQDVLRLFQNDNVINWSKEKITC